ncbi:MAG: F0F1 ATP synthase subunit delta [Steroidobacteraceae bacterium]|jgi:F-type H+-transporting ATPase subunit delta
MSEPDTLARPYASAAFEAARDAGAFEPWSRFLAAAAAAAADERVAALIGNPRVSALALIDFLLEIAGQPHQRGPERALLQLLAENVRLALLPEIAAQYEQLRAEAEHQADVQVIAAQALTPGQSQALRGALEGRLGRAVRLHESVDARLIGGALVRFGDMVIDGSLRGRIERMAAVMSGA